MVLERLGSGAMGVVYRAYDPQLDRKVAVKLLKSRPGKGRARLRDRLLREGQAMARLSHPNIVAVHDVGTHGEQVFVAMDLIEGGTLREWMDAGPRRWSEALPVFVGGGAGIGRGSRCGIGASRLQAGQRAHRT